MRRALGALASLATVPSPSVRHRRRPVLRSVLLLAVAAAALWLAAPAQAVQKGFWGPTQVDGVSQFPVYRDLGVDLFQMHLYWNDVAPTRPANPRDPDDPAYRWPADVDYALREAASNGMRVLLMPMFSPGWANGGKARAYAPNTGKDYADFVYAAGRRYPAVRHWLLWGEPTRAPNFQPMEERKSSRLTKAQAKAPLRYAKLLDAGYGALKQVSRKNVVIGGNSFTAGDVHPAEWLSRLRLPNGRPPRLDLYGHNPFCRRKPDLRNPQSSGGLFDFSDLRRFGKLVDRHFKRRVRLFLSEFTVSTGARDSEFNFWVTRETQAEWITAGFKVARAVGAHTFGWVHLYDDPDPPDNSPASHSGLLDNRGSPKPGYRAFKRG
jgi:hypothetical protein